MRSAAGADIGTFEIDSLSTETLSYRSEIPPRRKFSTGIEPTSVTVSWNCCVAALAHTRYREGIAATTRASGSDLDGKVPEALRRGQAGQANVA
jgi:hypothetical protein